VSNVPAPSHPEAGLVATRIRLEERLILEAFSARGVTVDVIDDRELALAIDGPRWPWRVVVNRCIAATRRLEVSRACEAWDIPVINPSQTIASSDDKIATMLLLRAAGLPAPRTVAILGPAGGAKAAAEIGFPAVVKPAFGSWGRGLCRINDEDALDAVLAQRELMPGPQRYLLLFQEFVVTPGRDIRVLVSGGEPVAAMYRASSHWVSNVARGAVTSACELTPGLADLAVLAAAAVGGGFVAVDLLEAADGRLLVNEVNSTPEFRGLMDATGLDIAAVVVAHAMRMARA
jgi:[lysine-biosynthesis-protein LysW]--L-2-aminoadipate ligase